MLSSVLTRIVFLTSHLPFRRTSKHFQLLTPSKKSLVVLRNCVIASTRMPECWPTLFNTRSEFYIEMSFLHFDCVASSIKYERKKNDQRSENDEMAQQRIRQIKSKHFQQTS